MNGKRFVLGLGGWLALVAATGAAEPLFKAKYSPPCQLPPPKCPVDPKVDPKIDPKVDPPRVDEPPAVPRDVFAQAPEAGTQAAETYNPNMFGDLIGAIGSQQVQVPGQFRRISTFGPSRPVFEVIRVPLATQGAFKIAENESPRPVNRVFINYNYFNDVLGFAHSGAIPRIDLHRETIGFETTFLDSNASFGMRLPFLQFANFSALDNFFLGDLSFIFKYALINDRITGNVLSGGLVVTAPTGEDDILLDDFDSNSTLLQPWGGFIYNMGSFYMHGFTSLVVPTDSSNVTFWANDLGMGWWAYRNNSGNTFFSAIVPTVEVHVNTPLNHRGSENSPIGFIDSVNLTGGVYWIFGQRTYLGTAIGAPVTGPRPFNFETLVNLNVRF